MPGPAKQPAALRLLNGRAPGKDSAGRPVNLGPGFVKDEPTPPRWLKGEALACWKRIVPGLTRLDLLKPEDAEVLVTYCEMWADFVNASAAIRRDGYYIEAKQGMLRHPAVGIKHQAARELRSIAAHFGLTPSTEQALSREGSTDDGGNPFS